MPISIDDYISMCKKKDSYVRSSYAEMILLFCHNQNHLVFCYCNPDILEFNLSFIKLISCKVILDFRLKRIRIEKSIFFSHACILFFRKQQAGNSL